MRGMVNVQSLDGSNNVTAQTTTGYDSLGRIISYTDTDGTRYTQNATISAGGQVAGSLSTLSSQGYAYDASGRLTTVKDTTGGLCTTRAYSFNTATDRTGLTSYGPGTADGTCQTTTAA